jgi:Gpi18-like mannosyltransferase
MADRRLMWAATSSAVAAVLFSAFVHSNLSVPNIYSDIASFWGRSWVAAGQVPDSSPGTFLEYPPLSGLFLYMARVVGGYVSGVVGGLYTGYYDAFSVLSLAAGAVMGWSTWRLSRALGTELNPVYFFLPSMLIYSVYNFDLFDALFVVLALQFFVEKRPGWSAVFLGAAVATKGIAVVLLPVFLLELAGRSPRLRYLAVSLAAAGVCFVPIALFNFGWFQQFVSYFSGWGLEDAWYIWIPWFSNPFSHLAKDFGYAVMALLLLRVYTMKMPLVPRSFLALTAYLLGTYIYAPQFNVTLVPVIAVLGVATPALYFFDAFNALIILTWFVQPSVIGGGSCPPASGNDPTWCPTWAWTWPQLMALLRSASLALVGLSVASSSGHSLLGWFRRDRGQRGEAAVQTKL